MTSTPSTPPLTPPSTPSTPPQSQPNGTPDPPTPATPSTPSTPSAPPPNPPPLLFLQLPPPSSPPPVPPNLPPTPPASPPSVPPPPPPPATPSPPPPPPLPPSVPAAPPPLVSPLVPSPPPPVTPNSPPPVSPSPPIVSPPPPTATIPPSPPPPVPSPPPSNVPPPLPSNSPPPPSATPPKIRPRPRHRPKQSHLNILLHLQCPPTEATPPPLSPPSPPPPQVLTPPPPDQPLPTPSPPPTNSSPDGNLTAPGAPPRIVPSGDPSPSSNVPTNPNSPSGGKGLGTGGAVAIAAVSGFVVLSLVGLLVWFLRKQKRKASRYNGGYIMPSPYGSSPKSETSFIKAYSSNPLVGSGSGTDFILSPPEHSGLGNSRSWFTYEELVQATNGFSAENLLGEGGFGPVYKGYLSDGREVAVKQLKIGSSQGEREFTAEVEIISRVHHRHLVSLVGYCVSDKQRLLVYDYLPNNTLYYHLHGEDRPVMDWATRFKVAAGAARGIAYLHEDCHPRIIHRDIKSSNILLDYNFDARVSDFGLARLAQDTCTHVSTRVVGTFGYMAPEYASSGKLTEKSDVFSFGVVLLELITGRKPVDASQPLGDESLVEWARPLLGHTLDNGFEGLEDLVDPRLEKNYIDVEMFRMIEVAAACVRHSAVKRPRMGLVMRALDSAGDSSDLSNGMRPGQSEVYDSAEQSAEIRMFRRMAFGSQEDYSTGYFSRSNYSDNHSRPWE
ncbi:LOW QUALITY PROTEIN: hypothetical protein Syun_021463 [Stephania yunnanensis]|uniref:non-specific serine/threonine protein kinase n=1 Tax=Stephania yunnanensis TaxID=152371 RepID=A0AAP0IFP4_9MAGN